MSEEMPALRWAIDTAATPGRWGDLWGDTHFADSLARALRRLGQTVTVDRKDTRGRPDRRRDDVALTLRGIGTDRPAPSPVNLLWVISHPDEVTAEEARSYDATFAASKKWALDKTAEWGLPVEPLLQCTDAQICDARHKGAAPAHPILFVGNARRSSSRPIVDWVGASAPAKLAIFGTGWSRPRTQPAYRPHRWRMLPSGATTRAPASCSTTIGTTCGEPDSCRTDCSTR